MKRPVKPFVGILALVVAIVGLVMSVFGFDIAEHLQPTPPVEEKIADFTVRVKDAVIAKLKNRDAIISTKAQAFSWHVTIPRIALGLGILGLVGASLSYIRGERRTYAVSAAGFGVIALAWQALMISLGAVVAIVIIFAVLNSLGIDISI
jgi:hypothetical protein